MADITAHSSLDHRRTGGNALLARVLRALARSERRYRDTEHLQGLPDYLLEDMGMTRNEALDAARNPLAP